MGDEQDRSSSGSAPDEAGAGAPELVVEEARLADGRRVARYRHRARFDGPSGPDGVVGAP